MTLLDLESCGGNPPFLWLHGFTQTAQSGYEFQAEVRATRALATMDLPGHGANASVARTLPATAADIAEAVGSMTIDLGGYSFGGRVALHVAANYPSALRRLVIVSATAGVSNVSERAERRARDEALAERCQEIGAEAFLREWTAQPLFATLPDDAIEFATRSRDAAGLAMALRYMGTGTQVPLDEMLSHCTVPTLIIAGEYDEKFIHEAHRLHDCLSNSRVVIVPRAGHAVHLEQPRYLARVVCEFLGEEDQNA